MRCFKLGKLGGASLSSALSRRAKLNGRPFQGTRCTSGTNLLQDAPALVPTFQHVKRSLMTTCSASTQAAPLPDRPAFNSAQAAAFGSPDIVKLFTSDTPQDVQQRLQAIVSSVPGLSEASRVVDVGSGTGCLIPHLRARGVKDILAVDLSESMLQALRAQHAADATNLGNELGVRTWLGDIMDLPNYLGWAADAFFFNGVFGNLHDPRAALLKAALMVKPGGYLVVSHPMGHAWHARLVQQQPDITPHHLPTREELEQLIQGLPLRVAEFKDEGELYLAVLQVPPRYTFPTVPLRLGGKVVTGFGRGSRQMGTPTANIDPVPLAGALAGLPQGVYYGWAKLSAPASAGWSDADLAAHKMVMNIGKRPTVNATGEEAATVEVHIMHDFGQDFYGQDLRVVALGYIRPEMRFPGGLPELVNRIKMDIAVGKNQLDDPENKQFATDPFLAL